MADESSLEAIQARAADDVCDWLTRPGVRDLFRENIKAWDIAEREQQRLDDDAERMAREDQLPLLVLGAPNELDENGNRYMHSVARLSSRWNRLSVSKLAADAPPKMQGLK